MFGHSGIICYAARSCLGWQHEKASLASAGDYEARSLSVLKRDGYYAHILNQGWVKSHGALMGNVWETVSIGKGCAATGTASATVDAAPL